MIKRMVLLGAVIGAFVSASASAQGIVSAKYADETTRYDHGILGDAIEYGTLVLDVSHGPRVKITLPNARVFEDIAPRLVDVDVDGDAEVMVVETSLTKGARLSIYDENGLVAATPYIGRTHRWLAPIGAADLDGDGVVEIAYIDRPHLARLLKIWQFRDGQLVFVTERVGLTNHNIGDRYITGGLRECGAGMQMITTDSGWENIVASTFDGKDIASTVIGHQNGQQSFKRALKCKM